MNEQIGVGDKVMVVWGCCAEQRRSIGAIAVVRAMMPTEEGRCEVCGLTITTAYAVLDDQALGCGWPIGWLKKMPPETMASNGVATPEEVGA